MVEVNGFLDEGVWTQAARLTDFTQYTPTDGQLARNRTEVLTWYSPTAIHFGVRAYAEPGSVRARLTERDRGIIADDYIEIQLGTFNDRRRAFVFAVNPLGVQADGALSEGSRQRFAGFEGDRGGREQADLSPDYTFDSRGRVTDFGYEVEVRIPFRSLRYQEAARQDWSLQVIRKVAASGSEDTWAPARRAAPSFVAQGGTLVGLTGIRRGFLLELNPIVTSSIEGSPFVERWRYGGGRPEPGVNFKLGLSTNVTRAVFLRVVGECRAVKRDSLRDDTRTNLPILIRGADGVYRREPALGFERNDFQADFLFSYQPTPGTVVFAGYGSSLTESEAFRFRGLSRTRDGFFAKLSYLFRL